MASRGAQKRLTREFKSITENPPPYITAHPSDSNILEWHYIITGPEETPYHGGQYWGTLMFPPDYPFAPPAIRMHTPSGRFQPSTRLCLSISDFHPRSFNPAWEVSTILIGLLSFMTSEEMTTGSVSATESERRFYARRSRWWNSTANGVLKGSAGAALQAARGNGRASDTAMKFRTEWPDLDKENWGWMQDQRIDPATGNQLPPPPPLQSVSSTAATAASSSQSGLASQSNKAASSSSSCRPQLGIAGPAGTPGAAGAAGVGGSGGQAQAVVDAMRQGRGAGQGWLACNKLYVLGGLVFVYVLIARLVGGDKTRSGA